MKQEGASLNPSIFWPLPFQEADKGRHKQGKTEGVEEWWFPLLLEADSVNVSRENGRLSDACIRSLLPKRL